MAILYYFCLFNEIERSHQLRVIDSSHALISVRSKKNATLAPVAQFTIFDLLFWHEFNNYHHKLAFVRETMPVEKEKLCKMNCFLT